MIKNFIIVEDGLVAQNIGGEGLTAEKVKELYPNGKIVELKDLQGVAVGLPIALFKDDFSLKTEKELANEGLNPEGKPIPTAEEIEAKAQKEVQEQQEANEQAKIDAAQEELRAESLEKEPRFSLEQVLERVEQIERRELLSQIYSVADQKHREVLISIYGSQMQYQRDSNRYERAKKGEFTTGENESLIKNYEQKGRDLDSAIDSIEEVRSYIADIADNDMARTEKALENWRNYLLEGDVGDFLASI